jgi:hypothetical protein
MTTLALSKSKKAVLFYPGDGSVFITSVAYMRMLLDEKAKGNLLIMKELKGADDNGIGNFSLTDKKKERDKGFDFGSMK